MGGDMGPVHRDPTYFVVNRVTGRDRQAVAVGRAGEPGQNDQPLPRRRIGGGSPLLPHRGLGFAQQLR